MANIQTLNELLGKRWRLRKDLEYRGGYIGSNYNVGCSLGTSGRLKYYYGDKVLEGSYVGDVCAATTSEVTGITISSLTIARTASEIGYLTDADGDSYGDNPRIVEFPKEGTLEVVGWMGSNSTAAYELQQFCQFWNANFEEVTIEEALENIADSVRQIHGETGKIPYLKISYKLDKAVENIGGIPSDGTATADDLLLGKTAYANGQKITGTIPTYDGTVSDEFTNELEDFITGVMKEYSNDKITSVSKYAFCGKALEKLSLPNATTAGQNAFAQCSSLIKINLSNLEKISGINAFQDCSALEYIYLPKLQTVPTQCFNGCKNLKTAILDSVTSIAGFGFQSCIKMENLIIRQSETICTLGNAFYGFTFTGTIYLPDSKVETYKSETNWSAYADQIKPLSEIPQEILDELEALGWKLN